MTDIVTPHYAVAPGDLPLRFKDMGDGTYAPVVSADVSIGDVTVNYPHAATGTSTNVSSSATSVTVLALNTLRIGATIFNDSIAVLYLKLGTTASATSYSVKIAAGGYYELPYNYTGRLDGIWASADGSARVTELT